MGGKVMKCVCKLVVIVGIVYCFLLTKNVTFSLPLSTSSKWIVDESTGSRVKLACVNWASHLTPMLAEGLHLHPIENIAQTITSWGFNCVKLTWATYMFTNKTLAEATVSQTFKNLGLGDELHGVATFNGKLVGLSTVEAFKEVVGVLGREGLMVVLDDSVSAPAGGEAPDDVGNGIFVGDASFDADIWVQGLQRVASLFKGWPNVVGMSLRNEVQPNQDSQEWYRHMLRAAEVIHDHNPDLLVMNGGLSSETDSLFLAKRPLSESLRRKVVYEVHKSSFIYDDSSTARGTGARCGIMTHETRESVGFLTTSNMSYTSPLFVGGFGVDQSKGDASTNDACFLAFAAHGDVDWAVQALQGSYYLWRGVRDYDESFGLFNHQWTAPRNLPLLHKLQALQLPFIQDIRGRPHDILFHPATGLCVNKVNVTGLEMGSCREASSWKLTPQGLIALDHTYLVLCAEGPAQEAVLTMQGTQANGPWTLSNKPSTQYTQVSTLLSEQILCLDSPSPPILLTNPCICLDTQQQCKDKPTSQWFIFVSSTST